MLPQSFSIRDLSTQIYNNIKNGAVNSGFSIPDFNNKEKNNQLIAEPLRDKKQAVSNVFVCPDCNHHLDLSNNKEFDYARKKAIQKFHFNIFSIVEV